MNSEQIKYLLIRGLDINFNGIKVRQPKICDIDNLKNNIIDYLSYTYYYCITKENLGLSEDFLNDLKDYSLFQTFFIYDELLKKGNKLNSSNSYVYKIYESLLFFLNIDINKLKIIKDGFVVLNDDEEIIWKLDSSNFEEFSELIRLITYSNMIKIEKDDSHDELQHYDDPEIQKMIEEQYRIYKEDKKKEELENQITFNDLICSLCINENSKYCFNDIKNLSVWQVYYYFISINNKDSTDMQKTQFLSGNFQFEKAPDLNWINKIKIKLPKKSKIIN